MSSMRSLLVNGEAREYPPENFPAHVADLVRSLGLDPKMVVAEVNGAIVPRKDLAAHPLGDGDRVELVRFVGGG